MAGANVYHVNAAVDLIVVSASGKLLAVEVKAASSTEGVRRKSYVFTINQAKPDFYVFVALDTGRISIMEASKIRKRGSLRLSKDAFSEEAMREGIARIVDA